VKLNSFFLPMLIVWLSCYSLPASATNNNEDQQFNFIEHTLKMDLVASKQFKCDGRQYCSQMTSREEAEFFINNCPNTKMDGDHDGKPCENDSRF